MLTNQIKNSLKKFVNDPFTIVSLIIILSIMVLTSAFIIIFWKKLPSELPLFYSFPWGEEQVGSPLHLVYFALSTAVIFLFSLFFSFLLHKKFSFYSHVLLLCSLSVVALGMITIIQIILLVT